MEHVGEVLLGRERRVVDDDLLRVAIEVGGGHEEVEPVAARQQAGGSRPSHRLTVHAVERFVEPAGHGFAVDRRAAGEDLEEAEVVVGQAPERRLVHPELGQAVLREVVRQRLGQDDAVDPAGRGAGDDVDDDPGADALGVLEPDVQQAVVPDPRRPLELAARRSGLGLHGVAQVGHVVLHRRTVGQGVDLQRLGGDDEAMQLLGIAMDVDRERAAAVADEGEPNLAHQARVAPARQSLGLGCSRGLGKRRHPLCPDRLRERSQNDPDQSCRNQRSRS